MISWLELFKTISVKEETTKKKPVFEMNRRTIQLFIVCAALFIFGTSGLFAEDSIAVLDDAGNKLLSLIGSTWVKAFLCIALVIEFGVVAFGNAQGEGGVIKKVLPWIVGTAGILGATSIVNFFFSNISSEELGYITTTVSSYLA